MMLLLYRRHAALKLSARCFSSSNLSLLEKQQQLDTSASPLFQQITNQITNADILDNSGLSQDCTSLSQIQPGTTYISKQSYVLSTGNIQYSPMKLNMLARQIKGIPIRDAIAQMRFGDKKPCRLLVKKLNEILRNTKQIQFGDPTLPDRGLVIAQAWVGKGLYQSGINIHAKGRFGRLSSPTSHMKIMVKVANVYLAPNRGNRYQGKGGFIPPEKMTAKVPQILPNKPIYNKWKRLFFDS